MSIAATVNRTIDRAPTGRIFGYEVFPKYRESPGAVVRAVNRSVENRRLKRVAKGRFYKPRRGALGDIPVSDGERLRDALYRNGRRAGYVTGPALYNRMGLTTQVPKTIAIAVNRATQIKDFGTIRVKLAVEAGADLGLDCATTRDTGHLAGCTKGAGRERRTRHPDDAQAFDGTHGGRAEKTAAAGARLLQRGHEGTAGNAAYALPKGGIASAQGFAQPHHAFRPGHRSRRLAGVPRLEHPVRLHEAPDAYLELIQATAAHIGIPAVHVEKDYWVTRVLKRLHESDYREAVVFKGGTSLSKAHRLIERFSEDIDLALKRDDGLSDSQAPCADQIDRARNHPGPAVSA